MFNSLSCGRTLKDVTDRFFFAAGKCRIAKPEYRVCPFLISAGTLRDYFPSRGNPATFISIRAGTPQELGFYFCGIPAEFPSSPSRCSCLFCRGTVGLSVFRHIFIYKNQSGSVRKKCGRCGCEGRSSTLEGPRAGVGFLGKGSKLSPHKLGGLGLDPMALPSWVRSGARPTNDYPTF